MPFKILNFLFFLLLLSCSTKQVDQQTEIINTKNFFINKGFTIVYDEQLYKEKLVNRKIEERSLIIFQRNLKTNTSVKITNLLNSKYLIATVGKKTKYPFFYNSVISKRIKKNLEIDENEPYIEIKEIIPTNSFVAKKAKTFDEEKNVADKAPVDEISIKIIGESKKIKKTIMKKDFKYILKIADFYFLESAKQMQKRISDEINVKNVSIKKLSSTKFRVFIGPFSDLNSLKKSFNAINVLGFESIEIIKN